MDMSAAEPSRYGDEYLFYEGLANVLGLEI